MFKALTCGVIDCLFRNNWNICAEKQLIHKEIELIHIILNPNVATLVVFIANIQ